jgi:hypothetical protein
MYTTKYSISTGKGKVRHEWKTINQVSETGYIKFTQEEKHCQRVLMSLLNFWNEVTEKYNIEYFACCGTLIGAIRNKGLIPRDDDIDLVVKWDYYDKIKQLTKLDFGQYKIVPDLCGFSVIQNNSYYPKIDVFIIKVLNGKYTYAGPIYNNKPTFYLKNIFPNEELCPNEIETAVSVPFENTTIKIPTIDISTTILKRNYGDDVLVRYVADSRTKILHKISKLPLNTYKDFVFFIVRDILKKDQNDEYDTHIVNLLNQIHSIPLYQNQDPKYIIKKIIKTAQNTKF